MYVYVWTNLTSDMIDMIWDLAWEENLRGKNRLTHYIYFLSVQTSCATSDLIVIFIATTIKKKKKATRNISIAGAYESTSLEFHSPIFDPPHFFWQMFNELSPSICFVPHFRKTFHDSIKYGLTFQLLK